MKSRDKYLATNVAEALFREILKYHRLLDRIVSDHDSGLKYAFWKRIMDLCGVEPKTSSPSIERFFLSGIINRMVKNIPGVIFQSSG